MFGVSNRLPAEMDRLFEGFFAPQVQRWAAGAPVKNFPPLAMWEDDESYHVEAELPGLSLEDVELYVKDREVTIAGKLNGVSGENRVVHRNERPTGEFKRELRLPMPLDAERVDATLSQGVLTLHLPKSAAAKGRKIEVKAG